MPDSAGMGAVCPHARIPVHTGTHLIVAFILFLPAHSRVSRAARIPEEAAPPGQAGKNTSGGFYE